MKKYASLLSLILLLICDFAVLGLYLSTDGERFDLDSEQNFPTLYQSAKIALAAGITLLLAYISRKSRKESFAWGFLTAGFAYLALDEWLQIHEAVSRITDEILLATVGRVSFSAWIVAYIPVFLLALVVFYLIYREVISAPKYQKVRKWFVLSAVTVFMVPVIEVVGTLMWNFEGPGNKNIIALEEGLEMVGITLFTFTFLKLLDVKLFSAPKELKQKK